MKYFIIIISSINTFKLNKNHIFFYLINLIFNSIYVLSTSSMQGNASDVHFMGETDVEERSYPYVHDIEITGSEIIEYLCIGNAECIRLSNCHVMMQLLDRSCLQTNKLHELSCGYTNGEPMVCCPKQNYVSNVPTRPTTEPPTVKPTVPVFTNEQSCGVPHLYNWQVNNYKGIGSQPWVVRVGFKNKVTGLLEHPCCGSIIGPRVILTTAHCALKKPETLRIIFQLNGFYESSVSVRVGEFDTSQNPDCTQTFCALPVQDIPLAHVVVHPGYSPKNYRHNIALLVLKNRLNYSVTVQPICLHQSHAPLEGYRPKLVGWGKLPGNTDMKKRQQQVELPVVNLEQCKRVYGSAVTLNDNELCVGGEEGKDACSGFGGAPLVLLRDHSRPLYTQIGIVSFGSERCGIEGVPSVYVRVDKYIDWINLNSPKEN